MQRVILPYCLLLCTLLGQAQSVPAQQGSRRADSLRVEQLLDEADDEFLLGSLDVTLRLCKEALALGSSRHLPRAIALAKFKIAAVYIKQDRSDSLMPLIEQGLVTARQLKDSFLLALGYYQKGQVLMYDSQLDQAEKYYHDALDFNFDKISSGHKGQVYNDLGYLYGQRGDLKGQADWFLRSLRVHEQLGDRQGAATVMGNLGTVYYNMGNRAEAIRYTRMAIELKEDGGNPDALANSYGNLATLFAAVNLDSALWYQQKATTAAEKNRLPSMLAQSFTNMSLFYDMKAGKGNRDANKRLALESILRAIGICREMKDERALAIKTRWAAQMHADLGDSAAMEAGFREATEIAERLTDKLVLRDIHGAKATAYTRRKDYEKALASLKNFYSYRDSVISENTATDIAELQTKYETEKKDNEILRLETAQRLRQLTLEKQGAELAGNKLEAAKKESEIRLLSKQQELRDIRIRQQEEQLDKQLLLARNNQQALQLAEQEKKISAVRLGVQRTQRNLILGGIAFLLVVAGFLFNRYQLRKKLQQQQVLLSVRNNIAKDLHDEIGSTLTSIRILSQVSFNNLGKDQQKSSLLLRQITEQSEQMQQGMSDIVWAIAPQNDRLENMLVRMREFVRDTLEPKNILTRFEVEELVLRGSIGMEQRRDFYLVFKEAVNNISKYAGATDVLLFLGLERGRVRLRITDNGQGFDPEQSRSSRGLKNMASRAAAMNGQLSILSAPGKGTEITLDFPAT
ncbi:MAG: tetratricopeptide repeat protein [Chitinophagaceae bacterium]|nr:MAG: tetratricopeptide repeat protein [Chitinophagaceae bacterium]